MRVHVPPPLKTMPLQPGQKALLGLSSVLLLASALGVWRSLPGLPARIPTHWSGASAPDGYGPPGTLWGLWWIMAALYVLLGLLAWQPPRGTLNGFPPIAAHNAGTVGQLIRSTALCLQLGLMLEFFVIGAATVMYALGGPNLMAVPLLLVVLVPLGLGYALYRASRLAAG